MTCAIPCCCVTGAATLIWPSSTGPRSRNPALRPLLRRAGLPELRDEARFRELQEALRHARDDEAPDWAAIGRPVATLLDTVTLRHPRPAPAASPGPRAEPRRHRARDPHLRRASARSRFERTASSRPIAAFNLIGDPDLRGRELLIALTGLDAARLQELDAAVQPGADLHRAVAGARPDQSAVERRSPSRCGSRCRSAIARPTTTRSSPRRC